MKARPKDAIKAILGGVCGRKKMKENREGKNRKLTFVPILEGQEGYDWIQDMRSLKVGRRDRRDINRLFWLRRAGELALSGGGAAEREKTLETESATGGEELKEHKIR